jgi:hypothetical protein
VAYLLERSTSLITAEFVHNPLALFQAAKDIVLSLNLQSQLQILNTS